MAKVIPVTTNEWCPNDCKLFELEAMEFYADLDTVKTCYRCGNLAICRAAVTNYNRWRREQSINVQSDISE